MNLELATKIENLKSSIEYCIGELEAVRQTSNVLDSLLNLNRRAKLYTFYAIRQKQLEATISVPDATEREVEKYALALHELGYGVQESMYGGMTIGFQLDTMSENIGDILLKITVRFPGYTDPRYEVKEKKQSIKQTWYEVACARQT